MDDFIASLSASTLPAREGRSTAGSAGTSDFTIRFSSEPGYRTPGAYQEGGDEASQASTASFAPADDDDEAPPTGPCRSGLDLWGLQRGYGVEGAGAVDADADADADARPTRRAATVTDSLFAASMARTRPRGVPLAGGAVATSAEFDMVARASFREEVQDTVIAELAKKTKFLKVAARATGRPFALTAPKDLKWLSWVPLPRVTVTEMVQNMGDEPFAALITKRLREVDGGLIFDLNDEETRHDLFDALADELGKRWHAAATGAQRTAEGANMTVSDVWPQRRGWNTGRNLMLQGDGIFAWQAKLMRMSDRGPPADEDEDEENLAAPAAAAARGGVSADNGGVAALLDTFRKEVLSLEQYEDDQGVEVGDDVPKSPFFATLDADVAARVLRPSFDTSFINDGTRVLNRTWKLTERDLSVDGGTLTFTFSRRAHEGRGDGHDGHDGGSEEDVVVADDVGDDSGSEEDVVVVDEVGDGGEVEEQGGEDDGEEEQGGAGGGDPVLDAIQALAGSEMDHVPPITGVRGGSSGSGSGSDSLMQVVERQSSAPPHTRAFRQAFDGGPSAPTETKQDLHGARRWVMAGGRKLVDRQGRSEAQVQASIKAGYTAFHVGSTILNKLRPALPRPALEATKAALWRAATEDIDRDNVLQQACLGLAAMAGATLMTLHAWVRTALEHNISGLRDIARMPLGKHAHALGAFWRTAFQRLEATEGGTATELVLFGRRNIKDAVRVTKHGILAWKQRQRPQRSQGQQRGMAGAREARELGNSILVHVELREAAWLGAIIGWLHVQDIDTMSAEAKAPLPRVYDVPALWSEAQWHRTTDRVPPHGLAASEKVKAVFTSPHNAMVRAPAVPDTTLRVFTEGRLFKAGATCSTVDCQVARAVHLGKPPTSLGRAGVEVHSLPTAVMQTLSTGGRQAQVEGDAGVASRLGARHGDGLLFAFMAAKLQSTHLQVLSTLPANGFGYGIMLSSYYHCKFKFQRGFAVHPLDGAHFEGWQTLPPAPSSDAPKRNRQSLARRWRVFAATGTVEGMTPPWVQTLVQPIMPPRSGCGCVRVVDKDERAKRAAIKVWGKVNDLTRLRSSVSPPYHANPFDPKEEVREFKGYEAFRAKQMQAANETVAASAPLLRVHGLGGALQARGQMMHRPYMFRPMPTATAAAQFLDEWRVQVFESEGGKAALQAWINAA